MKAALFVLICLIGAKTCCASSIQKANAHLIIGDISAAIETAQEALQSSPKNIDAWKILIKALAAANDKEKELIAACSRMADALPDACYDDDIIEMVSWGIISNYSSSSSPQLRLISFLAAYLSQDAKSIQYMIQGLRDNNSIIRSITSQIVKRMPDASLVEALQEAYDKEKNKEAHKNLLEAIGSIKSKQTEKILWKVVSDENFPLEEKIIAIDSLAQLNNSVDEAILLKLISSNRSSMRLLACHLLFYTMQKDKGHLLIPLINDCQGMVREAAWQALGLLGDKRQNNLKILNLAYVALEDPKVDVVAAAAWYLLLASEKKGELTLKNFYLSAETQKQQAAIAAIVSAGPNSVTLAAQLLFQGDLLQRANMALALIGQRQQLFSAGNILAELIFKNKTLLTFQKKGVWKFLAKNTHLSKEQNQFFSAEIEDQLTRLEILALLAAIDHPEALNCIRHFLQAHQWGITAAAASLLLSEGEEETFELISQLQNDSDPQVRIQAALVLAIWAHDESALQSLEKIYPTAHRELKEKILEAMGACATRSSIPFLFERLKEPFPILRLMAAAALLQVLYR